MTLQQAIAGLKYKSNLHRERYMKLRSDYIGTREDPYREALAYLLSLNEDTYENRRDLYSEDSGCIIPEGLEAGWQTPGSLRVTRLAFNLFTSDVDWCEEGKEVYCTPDRLFDSFDAPYFVEALKLRFYDAFKEGGDE